MTELIRNVMMTAAIFLAVITLVIEIRDEFTTSDTEKAVLVVSWLISSSVIVVSAIALIWI